MCSFSCLLSLDTTLSDALFSFARSNEWITYVVVLFGKYIDSALIVFVLVWLVTHIHSERSPWQQLVLQIKEILLVLGTAVSSWFIVVCVKVLVQAPRPFLVTGIEPLFRHGGFDSFPSGHTAFFMALAVAISYTHKGFGVFLGICTLLIGIARSMAFVHYPSDIIVGAILGAGIALILVFLGKKISRYF